MGGAGFLVWDDLLRCRRHWRRYRLQTKVVLFVNLVLVAGGAVLFLLLERENLGAGKSLGRQALEAVFDAVTPRTAGFNTTDTASLSAGSTLLTIILMVVGGGPGSTAGGVKVTTVAVLFVHTVAGIRREQSANAFGRSIGDSALKQATSVLFTNVSLALAGAVVISLVQSLPLAELLFETFSGLTRSLAPFSQAVVIFLMYCGRVGSISFAVALLEKKALPPVTLPQEDLVIG